MPTYEYQSTTPEDKTKSCRACRKPFELRRSIERSQDLKCPLCQNPIKKLVSRVSTPKINTFSNIDAKKAGFTVMKNLGDGILEKE